MVKSIIEEIDEEEKKKKRLALKRKREKERLQRERVRLQRERFELERKKQEAKKGDIIPTYRHKVEEALQDQSTQKGYESLPAGFADESKSKESNADDYYNKPVEPEAQQEVPEQPQPPPVMPGSDGTPIAPPTQAPKPPDTLLNIRELIDTGTKEDIHNFVQKTIRNGQIVYLPGINQSKCKFTDYGYRRLVEHIIENKDFLRIIVDIEDMQGVTFVTLSNLIRPKDDPADADNDKVIPAELTLRGLEGLCETLYSKTAEFDPYENEWKHLNNLLGCFAQPEIKGKVRIWKIETELTSVKLTAVKKSDAWIYRVKKIASQKD